MQYPNLSNECYVTTAILVDLGILHNMLSRMECLGDFLAPSFTLLSISLSQKGELPHWRQRADLILSLALTGLFTFRTKDHRIPKSHFN